MEWSRGEATWRVPSQNDKPRNWTKICSQVEKDFHPLLGANAIQKMALITVNNEKFKMVAKVSQVDEFISQHSDSIINELKDVFKEELGQLPGEVHLEVDSGVTPNVAAARRIPVALKDKLKVELEKQVKKKVIEPVSESTPWVSALALVVKKNGNLRICIDPRPLNKSLKREHFQLPTLDDLLPELLPDLLPEQHGIFHPGSTRWILAGKIR